MGGRLDSTNIIREPLLSVITGIALDHTAFLGDTVEKIAAEKAGIIKDGAPVLFGGEDRSASRVIEARAKEMGSDFSFVNYDDLTVREADLTGTRFDFGEHKNMRISLLGAYQPRNAAVVLSAVRLLRERGLEIPEEAVRRGLAEAVWHGRFEILSEDPLFIFDGAHNPQGIASAVESIQMLFPKEKVLVMTGVLRDKDYRAIASSLARVAASAFTMTPDNPRALPAEEYAEVLRESGVETTACESLSDALGRAREEAKRTNRPLFCLGSLYVYADLIKEIEK